MLAVPITLVTRSCGFVFGLSSFSHKNWVSPLSWGVTGENHLLLLLPHLRCLSIALSWYFKVKSQFTLPPSHVDLTKLYFYVSPPHSQHLISLQFCSLLGYLATCLWQDVMLTAYHLHTLLTYSTKSWWSGWQVLGALELPTTVLGKCLVLSQ